MSGTQALVEIVIALPAKKRDAWRALPEAQCLASLMPLPEAEGRVELTENTKNVRVVALFTAEAETRAEQLIAAFRAAASLGANGEATYFLLVDFQRESGSTLTMGEGKSALVALPAKKARAKHKVLDGFLEKCMMPPPPPPVPSDPALERAFAEALAKVRAWSSDEVDAAWQHVKATTMTSAAFGASKKQEKELLSLLERPPTHWEWAKVLPLRLLFPREPDATEATVLALLDGSALKQQEQWMLLEALCDSKTDAALERLLAALGGEQFLANVARRALAASVHPRATEVIVELAEQWIERAIANPDALPPAPNAFMAGAPPNEAVGILGLLQMRANDECDASMLRAWQRLVAERARFSPDAISVAVQVAHSYVSSRCRLLDPAVATPLLQRFPHMRVTLEQAQAAVDELHRTLPA